MIRRFRVELALEEMGEAVQFKHPWVSLYAGMTNWKYSPVFNIIIDNIFGIQH
jgi:hypothetical protein